MIPQCKNKKYKDITSECTFTNCTYNAGSVFCDEKAKMVYFNLMITLNTTSGWGKILELPEKYAPTDITGATGGGASITASVFWASVSSNKVIVQGELTSGKQIALQGYYHLKDFLDA